MKPTQNMLILAAALVMASCSQPRYYMPPNNQMGGYPRETTKQRQYLALPGQSAMQVGTEEADAAFDRQVQSYTQPVVQNEITAVDDANTPAGFGDNTPAGNYAGNNYPATNYTGDPYTGNSNPGAVQPGYPQPAPVQTTEPNKVAGTADYAVQITNGTTGRLFIEAQDAAGHIFPCGPMFAGQSISTPPDPVGPLKGPITVVIRDPDKPGAPEIRRYKVDPPANYVGKTVGITILPGGQYRADVDNQVYFTSPAPNAAGDTPAQ